MLIMAEVTTEMGAELRAAASLSQTSVAVEVGRRLERLARVEAEVGSVFGEDSVISFQEGKAEVKMQARRESLPPVNASLPPVNASLYSGPPNPWDMFRNTGRGR